MPKKIKVGILTNKTGAHVGAYLNALRDTEACESVVLADPDGHWVKSTRKVLSGKLKAVHRDGEANAGAGEANDGHGDHGGAHRPTGY